MGFKMKSIWIAKKDDSDSSEDSENSINSEKGENDELNYIEEKDYDINIKEHKKEIKDKLNNMCNDYYSKNNECIFPGSNIDKVPKKRKNETLNNEYASFHNEAFKKKEEIYPKKNNVKKNYK